MGAVLSDHSNTLLLFVYQENLPRLS